MPKKIEKLTENWKENISKSHLGKHLGEKNNMFGKHQSEYQRKRASETHKGKVLSKQTKEKVSNFQLGRKLSKETKQKMRISSFEYAKKICDIICPRVGHNEKQILDKLESELNYKILRQYECEGYFIDGYILEINLAIEVDENPKKKERDIERQKLIENKLNCKFIRIKDYD